MYEKPQYLTPNGYLRSGRNPIASIKTGASLKLSGQKNDTPLSKMLVQKTRFSPQKKGISDEAAKLIAEALKIMLRSKPL